jgi:hypothetical protein
LNDAVKQETPEIPPRRSSPWQDMHASPTAPTKEGCVEIQPAGWFPCASTRFALELVALVEHPAARSAPNSSR